MNPTKSDTSESVEQSSQGQQSQSTHQPKGGSLTGGSFAIRVIVVLFVLLVMWLPLAFGLGSESGIEWLFFGPLIFLSTFGLLFYLLISALAYLRKEHHSQSSSPNERRLRVVFGLFVLGIGSVVLITFAKPVYDTFKVERLTREETLQLISDCRIWSITRQKQNSVFVMPETRDDGRSTNNVDPLYFEDYKKAIETVSENCQIYINDDTRLNSTIEAN